MKMEHLEGFEVSCPLQVFTTVALVGMLITPLNAFPWVMNSILEAKVSLERLQRYFKLTNQDLEAYYTQGGILLFYLIHKPVAINQSLK